MYFCILKSGNMKKYNHVFFDLDRTLWDFDTNSRASIDFLVDKYDLTDKGVPSKDDFFKVYTKINNGLWDRYRKGTIRKSDLKVLRYELALRHFGIFNSETAEIFGREYLDVLPTKNTVFPGTYDLLKYLQPKYPLHIITNGFEEVQDKKMQLSELTNYFDVIITSEAAGARKPDERIFDYAMEKTGADPEESIMIGDDLEVDILGAKFFGMGQIYFNPDKKKHGERITHEVFSLSDIKNIL